MSLTTEQIEERLSAVRDWRSTEEQNKATHSSNVEPATGPAGETSTEEVSVEYREAVTEAKGLIKRSEEDQWRLAQLTWEQIEAGATQAEWARDIGCTRPHVVTLYVVWAKWKSLPESKPTFRDAYRMVDEATDDHDDAVQRQDDRRARSAFSKASPEERTKLIQQAIAEDADAREAAMELVRDEILEEHFKTPELRPRQKEWDNSYGESKREIEEERAGHTAMLDFSLYASRLLRFETQDLLTHADLTELQIWEGDLDRLIPMLLALREEIKTRLSRKVKVV